MSIILDILMGAGVLVAVLFVWGGVAWSKLDTYEDEENY